MTVGDRKHPITANNLSHHRKGRACKRQTAYRQDVIAATLCLYCLFVISLWWKNWYGMCLYTSLVSCGREEEQGLDEVVVARDWRMWRYSTSWDYMGRWSTYINQSTELWACQVYDTERMLLFLRAVRTCIIPQNSDLIDKSIILFWLYS